MKKTLRKILFAMLIVAVLCLCMVGCAAQVDQTSAGQQIETAAVEAVLKIICAAVVALIGFAGAWLTAKIGQNTRLSSIANATQQVITAAQQTVMELQQTLVDGWKAVAPDGKLTEAQIAQLKQDLLNKTLSKLAQPVLDLLAAVNADISAIITSAAEDTIAGMHMAAAAASG